MRMRRWMSSLLLPVMAMSLASSSAAQPATDRPLADRADVPQVWLDGPFGRVAGGSPLAPAGAQPGDTPLDTWMRGAPLSIETQLPYDDIISLEVRARSVSHAGWEEVLSEGATIFDGPSTAGGAVIEATLRSEVHGAIEYAWSVDVPDREPSQEALFEISAPGIELISDAGVVVASPGDGCYVYFCADTGELPPARSLEALPVGVGETLALRTDDDSALAGWNGRLTPLAGTAIDGIEAIGGLTDSVESMVSLVGLEAPSRGQWRLEVRVVFDRERGHQWQIFRLDAR
jgi:hypothetical protein